MHANALALSQVDYEHVCIQQLLWVRIRCKIKKRASRTLYLPQAEPTIGDAGAEHRKCATLVFIQPPTASTLTLIACSSLNPKEKQWASPQELLSHRACAA